MNKKDKHLYQILAAIFIGVLIATVVLFALILRYDKGNSEKKDALHEVSILGDYSEEGSPWKTLTRETEFQNPTLRNITVQGHFDRDLPEGEKLYLKIDHLWVSLRVNNEEIFRLTPEDKEGNLTRSNGKQWVSVTSPGITAQDHVELSFGNTYKNAYMIQFDELLWSMHTGDEQAMFFEGMKEDIWFIVISIVFIFLAFFLFASSLSAGVLPFYGGIQFLWLGFAALFTSIWFFTLSPAPTLLVPWPIFFDVLYSYSMQGIMIFATLFIAGRLSDWRKRLLMCCIGVLGVVQFIAVVNQMVGIQDLYSAINYFSVFDFLAACCILFCVYYEAFVLKREDAKSLLKSILFLAVFAMAELLNGYFQFSKASIMLGIGLFSFAVMERFYTLEQIRKRVEDGNRAIALEKELVDSRISIMLSQIQPHFLYNALNSIHYLCRTSPEKAAKVVENFSNYLRGNMDSLTATKPISIQQELEHLENFLSIERLRFPNINFTYDLQSTDFSLPALTLQPLVENAIRHGVNQREEGGNIKISSWEDTVAWYLRVDDDGVGFDSKGAKDDDGRSHVGLSNIRSRLHSMCYGTLMIESVQGQGTVVTVTIPKKEMKP